MASIYVHVSNQKTANNGEVPVITPLTHDQETCKQLPQESISDSQVSYKNFIQTVSCT